MTTIWQYHVDVLTSMVGRDKIRMDDLQSALAQRGKDGWELAAFVADADIKGQRDGHLLIFKQALPAG